MATRGAFGLTHKGQTKMIYNHWDSYPDGLGREFVDWIKSRSDDELKKAFNNIKLGRCENYGLEKFIAGRDKKQTWDMVTQEQIDEDCYIEYSYNYNIDSHTLITTGEEHSELQDLEDEIQEDRKQRAGLIHMDTTDRYDYKGKVLTITRTGNSTTVEYNGKKKTEEKYMTPIEAVELITKG
jgi:hypothetical protein